MTRGSAIAILILAALLEAGGDAVVRSALRATQTWPRVLLFGLGALVLFAYGYTVNAPPWDFGRLLGLYVVFFFVAAQLISWIAFHQVPSRGVLFGGIFIVIGGCIIAFSEA